MSGQRYLAKSRMTLAVEVLLMTKGSIQMQSITPKSVTKTLACQYASQKKELCGEKNTKYDAYYILS